MLRKTLISIVVIGVLVGFGFLIGRATEDSKASQAAAGGDQLTSEATPLKPAEVEELDPSSPERAVFELIYWAQWGNLPAVLDGYVPSIIDGLTVGTVTSAYSYLRSGLSIAEPRIETIKELKDGDAFVALSLLRTGEPPIRESFLLEREDGEWLIKFDTLLERGLTGYSGQLAQKPGNADDGAAFAAGEEVARLYRDLVEPTEGDLPESDPGSNSE